MRIVIAEDAAVLREGLVRLLTDRGHEVCAAVADDKALRTAVTEHTPDVVIADIRMPPTHTDEGLRAAIIIRRDFPSTGVLLSRSTSRPATWPGCSSPAPGESATCSRSGSATWPISSPRWNGSPPAAPPSTRR